VSEIFKKIRFTDNVQVAPQEVEVSSYLVGQIDSEVDADDLSNFQLSTGSGWSGSGTADQGPPPACGYW
jgi:hypothetical protein